MISIHPLTNYIFSIVAGILILIFPQILNYIVALYLVLIGIVGVLANV
jgi:hypothetical protein